MKKISIMLAITMLVSVFSFGTLNVSAAGEEPDTSWYGDRTATEFLLADAGDLLGFADLVNKGDDDFSGKTVKLTADIDMSGITDFTGIGFYGADVSKTFSGTFDGNGNKIKNVTISKLPSQAKSTENVGVALFGSINGSTIKNLGLENMALYFPNGGQLYDCGGFVSHADGDNTIENCYVNGLKMTFGYAKNGLGQTGGFIGYAESGTLKITDTYIANFDSFTYDVDEWGGVTLGSFFGNRYSGTLNMTNCYAAPIENCYIRAAGNITLIDAGQAYGTKNIENFVWVSWSNAETTKVENAKNIAKWSSFKNSGNSDYMVTDAELKALGGNIPTGFKNAYMTGRNGGYPVSVKTEATAFASGTGTEADPYIIDDENSLRNFARTVNAGKNYSGKFVKLTNDIALNGYWTPIGYYNVTASADSKCFKGTFDGDGHVVSNININRASTATDIAEKSAGFFGCAAGTIKNLGLKDVTIDFSTGNATISYIGGFVGAPYGKVTITDCYLDGFTVSLNGEQGYKQYGGVGGIIGSVEGDHDAAIDGCYVRDVSYTQVGKTSAAYMGGLVGLVGHTRFTLTNSYVVGFSATIPADNVKSKKGMGAGTSYGTSTTSKIDFYYVGEEDCAISTVNGTAVTDAELKTLTGGAADLADKFNVSKYGLNDGYPTLKSEKLWVFDRTGNTVALSIKGTHVNGTKLILAVYEGERFVDASIVSSGTTLGTDLELSAGTYTVKGFLWNENLSPLETIPYENTVTVQ